MNKKYISILLIIAAAGFIGWRVFQKAAASPGQGGARGETPLAVVVSPVERGDIADMVTFSGSLQARSEFLLAPKVTGRLKRLDVEIGDAVRPGRLAAVLDDAEYKQQVIEAEAELEVARANRAEAESVLENARRSYQRTLALRKGKIASESEMDTATALFKTQEAKLRVAEAQIAQRSAALNIARVRLSYTRVDVPGNGADAEISPESGAAMDEKMDEKRVMETGAETGAGTGAESGAESGAGTGAESGAAPSAPADPRFLVVGERFVDEGALLSANDPIVSILDIGTLTAVIHVIERDYGRFAPGLAARIETDAWPDRHFEGKVMRIAPALGQKSREARVEIAVPNPDHLLKPGMFVRARIIFDTRENVPLIPAGAVVKRGDQRGIFLEDPSAGRVRFTPVTLGIVSNGMAEVVEPAVEGRVVTLGQHLLEDGAPIVIPDDKPQPGDSTGQTGAGGTRS